MMQNQERRIRRLLISVLSTGTGNTNKTSLSQHAENSATVVLSYGHRSQMSLFTSAVIHGGQFTISINSLNKRAFSLGLNQSFKLAVQDVKVKSSSKGTNG